MNTVILTVEGMNCGGCVNSVTRILEGIAGVAKAEVELEAKRATVTFNPAQTDAAALIEAVEDGGYDAALA